MADNARLSAAIRDVAEQLAGDTTAVLIRVGTVLTVTAGAAADGNAAVAVTVNGNDLSAPYDSGYTPTVGDLVMVLLVDGSPFIIGKLIGFPVV